MCAENLSNYRTHIILILNKCYGNVGSLASIDIIKKKKNRNKHMKIRKIQQLKIIYFWWEESNTILYTCKDISIDKNNM